MNESVTTAQIRDFLRVPGPVSQGWIARVSSLAMATPDAVVFAAKPGALASALQCDAGLILVPEGTAGQDRRMLPVKEPRVAFALVYDRFFRPMLAAGVHASAIVESGAEIGAGSRVDAGAYIGPEVRIGEGCWIGARCVILGATTLGNRVRIQAGAVLGSDGFGYVRGERGMIGFPQVGTLELGDDVEIGAGTTIDRGALETTSVGRGTKIDNLVHIAHNCRIGEDVLIAAQVGIAGSSVIGDRAILGGQVGIGEHVVVGEGVILGGQAGLISHKRLEGPGVIFWGTPAQPVGAYLRNVARMRRGR